MGRIQATFEQLKQRGETALIPFITAGDPDLATTEELIHTLVENGADLIELGFPFSDPMADGPTIQAASERALESGTTLPKILDMVARVREHTNVPIVLMGYYNPLFSYGPERFAADAAAAGVDGLLLVDLPAEETGEIRSYLQQAGICLIQLLAPTTPPQRMKRLVTEAGGFVYFVSMTGVTGASQVDASAIEQQVTDLQQISPVPVAVGFGISSPADAEAVARFADAVVVGSALVKVVEAYGKSPELPAKVGAFVRSLKDGLR
ncbi:tryptophan synthase subunit alpha [Syntrophotalea acetylenivorans]|uniref:Tryptophan synthase alpha chain n=1 Tax=Syntrophotalea acetylenivorans TaxID=1842532 RepID=A0A1L3GP03_9BACT|nr:tryptophan synthase subunit alpha [Syntrophotalea acetylenivorans]APG27663.1 tryptophan synthase subunit alpha [Syntrophotalea acetylenivorans]